MFVDSQLDAILIYPIDVNATGAGAAPTVILVRDYILPGLHHTNYWQLFAPAAAVLAGALAQIHASVSADSPGPAAYV